MIKGKDLEELKVPKVAEIRAKLLSFIEESQIISRGPLSPKGSLVF